MPKQLQEKMKHIIEAVKEGEYRYTIHGARQRIERRLSRKDIEEAMDNGEIIEDYPKHHYGPACLVLGKTEKGLALHILCSLQIVVDIITVYKPNLEEWEEDLKTRRKKMTKCSICKSTLIYKKVTYTQELGGKIYIVNDVPAFVCSQCGEKYLSPETVDRIQEVIEKGEQKKLKPVQQIPVFHFA